MARDGHPDSTPECDGVASLVGFSNRPALLQDLLLTPALPNLLPRREVLFICFVLAKVLFIEVLNICFVLGKSVLSRLRVPLIEIFPLPSLGDVLLHNPL